MSNENPQQSSEPQDGKRLITYKLNHQTQPCPVSCVATCMAMLARRPAVEIRDKFHERYLVNGDQGLSIRQMLTELVIPFRSFDSADRNSISSDPGFYLLCVPSLNIVGGNHQILMEMRPDGWWQVFDPAMGLMVDGKARRYYVVYESLNPLETMLHSGYTIEAYIPYNIFD